MVSVWTEAQRRAGHDGTQRLFAGSSYEQLEPIGRSALPLESDRSGARWLMPAPTGPGSVGRTRARARAGWRKADAHSRSREITTCEGEGIPALEQTVGSSRGRTCARNSPCKRQFPWGKRLRRGHAGVGRPGVLPPHGSRALFRRRSCGLLSSAPRYLWALPRVARLAGLTRRPLRRLRGDLRGRVAHRASSVRLLLGAEPSPARNDRESRVEVSVQPRGARSQYRRATQRR
jgi:hypothetical protein